MLLHIIVHIITDHGCEKNFPLQMLIKRNCWLTWERQLHLYSLDYLQLIASDKRI